MTNKLKIIASMTLSLAVGVGGTVLVGSLSENSDAASTAHAAEGHDHAAGEQADEESKAYYTCPMHPSVVSETPGACPVCGMDLVKKTQNSSGMDAQELAAMGRVSVSPTQRVLANVETAEASAQTAEAGSASEIRAIGVVSYDEEGLASIPSWVDGRIEKLLVRETGAVVKKGQPVMKIYSEELVVAQEEYLISLESSGGSLARQTKKRLELLGMSAREIAAVRKSRQARTTVTAYAPNAGTITNLNVRQGQYVNEGTPLYDIADLSEVWVDAEIYENNLSAVHEGMTVRVVAEAYPGEPMEGTISFIHPVVDSDTRTVKVRVELDNADGKLKPGMYTSVFIQKGAEDAQPQVMVPKSAVIRGGKTNSVYVEVEENLFERREVELGRSTDELLVITSGVEAGETVAYRGGFLLDSEVQLNSFGGSGGGHNHGGGGSSEGGASDGESSSDGDHKAHKKLTHADIPADGKEFDPAVPADTVPDGAWYCEMNDESHWVQHEKGDGECPVCGMFLKEKQP